MFRITPNPTFAVTVKVPVIGQEAPSLLKLVFRRKSREELVAWVDRARAGATRAMLCEVIAGWEEVEDDAGNPVPYSEEGMSALLGDYPDAPLAIFNAYIAQLPEFREKN